MKSAVMPGTVISCWKRRAKNVSWMMSAEIHEIKLCAKVPSGQKHLEKNMAKARGDEKLFFCAYAGVKHWSGETKGTLCRSTTVLTDLGSRAWSCLIMYLSVFPVSTATRKSSVLQRIQACGWVARFLQMSSTTSTWRPPMSILRSRTICTAPLLVVPLP